ncbi:hypothetical protein H6S61_02015 [Vibrio vulnificus]|uniref:hypothetical protein n=1 Tax=Vibrio vulnificus TaxID=672 RepID=UPI00163B6ABC|nr:hypothetical protein [Vibrio vulnificus]QNE01221.1 hypothetical protein H6S61_02015 [Vibrio vulnificus]
MKKEYFYQGLFSVLISLIISPLTLYVAFVATNIFKSEEIELKYVKHATNLETFPFSTEIQKQIARNPDSLSSLVMDFMTNGFSDASRNPDIMKSFSLITDYSKGDLSQNVTPTIACVLDETARKRIKHIENQFNIAQRNINIIQENLDLKLLEDVGTVDAWRIISTIDLGSKDNAIKQYEQFKSSIAADYTILKNLSTEAATYCDIHRIKRDGTLTITTGFVNKGFATGVVSPHAEMLIGNNRIPLINVEGVKYQPISEKDFVQVSYKLNLNEMLTSEQKTLKEILNENKSVEATLTINTLDKEIRRTFTLPPVYEEYAFYFEESSEKLNNVEQTNTES